MTRAWRQVWRRLRLGVPTILGVQRRGYFIPYRYAAQLPQAGEVPGYESIEALLAGCTGAFLAKLREVDALGADLLRIGDEGPEGARWDQTWFPGIDAAVAYAMVRQLRPRRIVEVGSGHSTRFLARAVRDGSMDTRITCIDPAPRAAIEALAVELIRTPVPLTGMAPFRGLAAGDILFIDSSHILMPGSDVDFLLNRVLPALPAGVVVHVHDVFLPDDYPADWSWRGYNEQLAVIPMLTGGAWRPLFASHYVWTRLHEEAMRTILHDLPLPEDAHEASLWMEKVQ